MINFGNEIGMSDCLIRVDGKNYLKLTIEVFPSKIGYKEMMEEYVHNPIAHSCGKLCGHMRGGSCTHPCNCLCHPGPCPPCSMIIELPCQCGKTKCVCER